MSLDLSVVMKDRMSKEMMASLEEFLKKRFFVKEKYLRSSWYSYGGESACIDVYIARNPMKRDGSYWREVCHNGRGLDFLPKATIDLESRHSRNSHRKSYSLAKGIAAMVGGVIYDLQMSTAYNHRGVPLWGTKEERKSLQYGAPIDVFMGVVAEVKEKLVKGSAKKRK